MNVKTTLLAATLAAFATSAVYAAEETRSDAKAETPKAEKAETKKPVKRHDHAAEKTGTPAMEPAQGKSHREMMDKDMPMHDHTKDRH